MPSSKPTIDELIEELLTNKASDLHLSSGLRPIIRVDGGLVTLEQYEPLSPEYTHTLIMSLLTEDQQAYFSQHKGMDFSIAYRDKARFRVNTFHHGTGLLGAALRHIPTHVGTFDELNLPDSFKEFANARQGFVLLVGPSGQGKSTTLASMINYINHTRSEHIVTIEDPIEYLIYPDKSLVHQREIGIDTRTFPRALRATLRQDINVVMIGEMRDLETISTAVTVAETGHLVFATLHTNDASQTVDRIIDAFPAYQQKQVALQLSNTLLGIVSQRLLPKIGGGRVPAVEVMKMNPAIANLIRLQKSSQIPNVMQTSVSEGMVLMEQSLANLVNNKVVSKEVATAYAPNPKYLTRLLS